jgi:hypothetical protein
MDDRTLPKNIFFPWNKCRFSCFPVLLFFYSYFLFGLSLGSVNTFFLNILKLYTWIRFTRVGPKVSGLTYKSHDKWKILRGIYSAIYGEVNVSVSVCVEIKGDYTKKQQNCFISVTLKSWSGRNLFDLTSYYFCIICLMYTCLGVKF